MKFGVIVFPGSNCDHDAAYAVMGMMPHPERAREPLTGSSDGLVVSHSMLQLAATALPVN